MSDKEWKEYVSNLLESVRVLYFPKELKKNGDNAIINDSPKQIEVSKMQNFIDIDVEGQILGILWVMTVGRVLDKEIYVHSYGNRIKERTPKLNNQPISESSYSPYLFEPYFVQYESWRDKALDVASEILDKKQDTIILTMDFTRFYYSLHISKEDSDDYYGLYTSGYGENESVRRINAFVYLILRAYSRLYDKNSKKNFLPIGFFPSNILSNYSLKSFDDGIIKRWNPMYYGRYVDDIIIVDKVEKNSALYQEAQSGILSNGFVMNYFLCNCNADKSVPCFVDKEMLMHLYSSLCRGLSLIWGDAVKKFIYDISCDIQTRLEELEIADIFQDINMRFDYKAISNIRQGYCYSRMCDKYALISCIDFVICRKSKGAFKYRVWDGRL